LRHSAHKFCHQRFFSGRTDTDIDTDAGTNPSAGFANISPRFWERNRDCHSDVSGGTNITTGYWSAV
jgi:hypothetical protein